MSYYYSNNGERGGGFMSNVPVVTKNLLIINVILFAATFLGERFFKTNVMGWLVLYDPHSVLFRLWQPVTYMFMHGGFWHLFMNMYTLYIFGSVVERMIGSRKFTILYLISGLGAAEVHLLVMTWMRGAAAPMLGASGAVYGVLIAYAMIFPNSRISLIFPPISLNAKWMVIIFAVLSLVVGVTGTAEGVAHFAHLGGMIFGFLVVYFWKKAGRLFDRDNF